MNLKQQIYHAIVDHHRRFGQVPRRDELRRNFRPDPGNAVDAHLDQLAREGLLGLGMDDPDRITLTGGSTRRVTEIGIQGSAAPERGTIALDLGGIGLALDDDAHALRVADDLMIDAGIQTGDIAILQPGVPLRGDIVAALIGDRLVLRRFLVIQRIPHLLAENPGHPDLRPAFDTYFQGILCALLRVDFGRQQGVRSGPTAVNYLAGAAPADLCRGRELEPARRLPQARPRLKTARSGERRSDGSNPSHAAWPPPPPSGNALNEPAGACFDAKKTKKARRARGRVDRRKTGTP